MAMGPGEEASQHTKDLRYVERIALKWKPNPNVSGFFSGGQVHDAIELVDVYQLMCFLLNIEPRPNDGEWSRVRPMLRNAALTTHSSLMIALVLWSSTVTWFTFGAR